MMQLVLRRKSRKGNVTVGRGGSIFGGDTLYRSWILAGSKKNAEHQSSNRGQQHIVLKVIHTCLQVICF